MCTFGLLDKRVETPAASGPPGLSPRAQTCTFEGPGLHKNHQNSTRRHTVRERKITKWWREREKKERNFGRSGGGGVRRRGRGGVQRKVVQGSPKQTTTQQHIQQHTHTTKHNNKQQQTTQKWIGQNWLSKWAGQRWIGHNWIGQSRPHPGGGVVQRKGVRWTGVQRRGSSGGGSGVGRIKPTTHNTTQQHTSTHNNTDIHNKNELAKNGLAKVGHNRVVATQSTPMLEWWRSWVPAPTRFTKRPCLQTAWLCSFPTTKRSNPQTFLPKSTCLHRPGYLCVATHSPPRRETPIHNGRSPPHL